MNQAQLFQNWRIPFVPMGRDCAVPRTNAAEVIRKIYGNGFVFLGYDAFTVFPDGKRQPITDFCAAYSANNQPRLDAALQSLKEDPSRVTHYVFGFRSGA